MQESKAFEIVRTSLSNGRLPHAYLVVGAPRGAGRDFARRVCALLLCEDRGRAPCGACDACDRVARDAHPDVLVVEPEKKSRVIGIEPMRETFLPWAAEKSFSGGWKAGLILFADRLRPEAANAFLKTLEEPPEDTLFLLVTDQPDALLPTVVSRCQRIDLTSGRTPPPEPWRSRVAQAMSEHSNASALRVMATSARLHDLFVEIHGMAEDQVLEEVRLAAEADPNGAGPPDNDVLKALVGAKEKELRRAIYVAIQDWYRDVLVLSSLREAGSDAEPELCYPEFRDVLRERARLIPPRLALRYVDFAKDMQVHVEDRNMADTFVFPHWLTWMH